MKYPRHLAVLLLAMAALIAGLASCGGGSPMNPAGELEPADQFAGISEGDFKAVRYNDRGYRDSSLNSSIDLRSFSEDGMTVVEIGIMDESALSSVALELHYDAEKFSPVSSNFSGLLEADIELSSFSQPGIVALGQVDADNAVSLSGNFARIEFENGPSRAQSAAGDAHQNPVIFAYGTGSSTLSSPWSTFQFGNTAVTDSEPATYTLYGAFAGGDGNQDGESNIGDITPLGILLGSAVGDSDYSGARADYDYNTSVNISDITPLAVHLGESTSTIEIFVGDSDTFDGTETMVDSHSWTSGTAPSTSVGTTTTDWSGVWMNWSGEISMTQVMAADTNADGIVYVGARAAGSGADGPLSVSPSSVSYMAGGVPGIEITDFDITILDEGDNEQTAVDGNFNWPANGVYDFVVDGVHGAWDENGDGTPETAFTPGNLAGLEQQRYDDALAAVTLALSWDSGVDGDSTFNDFHSTWTGVMEFTPSATGATGTVFPDDDPDSTIGSTPEGSFAITLAQSGEFVPVEIAKNWTVDVASDGEAVLFQTVLTGSGMDGDGMHMLSTSISSFVQGTFFWGSGGHPSDLSEVSLRLYDLGDSSQTIEFEYVASEPVGGGEFHIRNPESPGGPFGLSAMTQLDVTPGHSYGLQIMADGKWSSINKPGEFFAASPAPSPVELDHFPKGGDLGDDTTMLHIFRPDPLIRRNDNVIFDLVDKTSSPVDNVAFQDVLALGGDEFPVGQDSGTSQLTPIVRFAEGVDGQDVPWDAPDLGVIMLNSSNPQVGRIDLEIQALNVGAYGYQVFDRNRNPLGYGNIVINEFIFDSDLDGVDWGINICDDAARGDLALTDRDFSGKVLSGNSIGMATPDVMWFEFNGTNAADAQLRFGGGNHVRDIHLVAAGLGNLGFNVLAIYSPTAEDFQKIGAGPEWIGTLDPGSSYELTLFSGADEYTWSDPADNLIIVGANPND